SRIVVQTPVKSCARSQNICKTIMWGCSITDATRKRLEFRGGAGSGSQSSDRCFLSADLLYRASDDRLVHGLPGLRVRASHSPCCCLQASPCNQDWELPLTKLARKSRHVRPSWVYAVAIGVTVPRVPVLGFSHGMLVSFSPRLSTALAAARA